MKRPATNRTIFNILLLFNGGIDDDFNVLRTVWTLNSDTLQKIHQPVQLLGGFSAIIGPDHCIFQFGMILQIIDI